MKSHNKSKENLPEKNIENHSKSSSDKEKRTRKEPENDSFLKIKQKADEAIKDSLEFAVNASEKIDKNIKEGIQKTKDSSIYQEVQHRTNQIRTMDQSEKNRYKHKIIHTLIKIRDVIFGLFEKFVGRIRVGTQYGKSSIDLLSELAKLKELGIITEKEFEAKKKEILDRI
ncbi:MAG: hypothetical protein PVJ16_02580 [Nitrosopumilaceae archaeon]